MAVLERVAVDGLAQGAVPPGYTFTRSTAALYVDSDGLLKSAAINTPRRQWDATNRRWGYVGEGSRTNSVLRSEEFDNASWTKTRSSVSANATTAPDGASTADKVVEDSTAASTHFASQTVAGLSSTATVTFSVYAKQGERSRVTVQENTSGATVAVNLADGSVISGTGIVTASGNGWYRISVTGAIAATSAICAVYLRDASSYSYGGDGTSGIYLWGAQCEVGPTPSSYIPTTTVAVTRGADLLTRALTGPEGTALSTQGTMVVEFSNTQSDASGTVYAAASVSSSLSLEHAVYRYISSNGSRTLNAGVQYDQGATAAVGVAHKMAHAWIVDNCQGAIDGALLGNDAAPSSMPAVTTITIGGRFGGAAALYGLIYGWTIYDDAKTDAELQALTTPTTNRNQSRLTLGLGLGL